MWIFIWFLLSSFVLGVFAWSLRILFQQKAAWKAYAKKMNLTYQDGPRFLSSPVLSGSLGPYGFGLYTEEQRTNDTRGQRFSTILEIALRHGLPVMGAMGTQTVIPIIQSLRLDQSVVPQDKDWDPSWMIRTRHAGMVEKYLTPQRLEIIKKIFRMKVLSAFFIFDEQDAVLRIETADPLNDSQRLEKIVKGLIQHAEGLIVKNEERSMLDALVRAAPPAPLPEPPPSAPVEEVAPRHPMGEKPE